MFLFFYKRIFPGDKSQLLINGTIAVTSLYGIAFVLSFVFQCWPVQHYWRQYADKEEEGYCSTGGIMTISHAVIGIVLDIWIIAIAVTHVYGLNMNLGKKLQVGSMFSLGLM